MHIVTLMDYKSRNPVLMCKVWIYLAKRYNPHAKISIYYQHAIPDIYRFANHYHNISFYKLHFPAGIFQISNGHTHHPVQDLRLALWKHLERQGVTKFIYVDADAFILHSLADWWKIINKQPYIAVIEQRRGPGVFRLNAGVHSYSDEHGFVTYEKLLGQYHADGRRILVEAGEQGLIDAYFRRIHYDFTHPLIGHEYNTLAKYCKIYRVDDSDIEIYSGDYPLKKRITQIFSYKEKRFDDAWYWWNKPVRVKILHSFGGPGFRFWELPECHTLWKYLVYKIRVVEHDE
jgi:hypothetical protein